VNGLLLVSPNKGEYLPQLSLVRQPEFHGKSDYNLKSE